MDISFFIFKISYLNYIELFYLNLINNSHYQALEISKNSCFHLTE
jgi:hypothetical protein